MISCPHHSFLSHAGGEKERQTRSKKGAGTAGHGDRAAGGWGAGPSSGSGTSSSPDSTPISTQSGKSGAVKSREHAAAACCRIPGWGPLVSYPCCRSASRGRSAAGPGAGALQMDADSLSPVGLGLLLLPFLVTLLAALCVRCRELPGKWGALRNRMVGTPLDPHTLPGPGPGPDTLQLSLPGPGWGWEPECLCPQCTPILTHWPSFLQSPMTVLPQRGE